MYTIWNCYTLALFKDRLRTAVFRIYRLSPCCSSEASLGVTTRLGFQWFLCPALSHRYAPIDLRMSLRQVQRPFAQFPFHSQPSVLPKGTCTLLTHSQHYQDTKLSPLRVLVWKKTNDLTIVKSFCSHSSSQQHLQRTQCRG